MRFFNNIKVCALLCNFRFSYVLGLICGLIALYSSCDTPEDVKPSQGQTFIKLFGGEGTEEGMDLVATADGGFVLVGSTTSNSFGGKDVFVVRTDSNGNVIWEANMGGIGDDSGNSVIIAGNDNIYVCGERAQDDNPALRDAYVLNFSIDGSLLGEYTFGDSLRDEYGTDILDIDGSGFLITSTWLTSDTSKYFIVETDENLVALDKRSRYVAGSKGVENYSISSFERTNISNLEPPFSCFGSAQQIIGTEKVMKFQSFYYRSNDDEGIDEKLYGPDNSDSYCTDLKITSDGGYVMCGYNVSGEIEREMVVRLNPQRELVGEIQIYDNDFGRNILNPGVFQTNDGGFIVVSTIELDDPLNDEISLLKLNNLGVKQWRKTYGSNDDDYGRSIIQLEDGSYVLVGTVGFEINPDSQAKMCLMKMNRNGDLVPL